MGRGRVMYIQSMSQERRARLERMGALVPPVTVAFNLVRPDIVNFREIMEKQRQIDDAARLSAQARMLHLAKFQMRKQIMKSREARSVNAVSLARILEMHASACGIPVVRLIGSERNATVVRERQTVCWLMRSYTGASYPQIARAMGGKDHTTILHAVKKIDQIMGTNVAMVTRVNP
jgi:chromosomal replication initiator protein